MIVVFGYLVEMETGSFTSPLLLEKVNIGRHGCQKGDTRENIKFFGPK